MKKVITILAVVIIALVGLTSYNANETKKEKNNDTFIASVKASKGVIPVAGGGKKLD
jgi:hypothetical protein